jgi:hypothetical protein
VTAIHSFISANVTPGAVPGRWASGDMGPTPNLRMLLVSQKTKPVTTPGAVVRFIIPATLGGVDGEDPGTRPAWAKNS